MTTSTTGSTVSDTTTDVVPSIVPTDHDDDGDDDDVDVDDDIADLFSFGSMVSTSSDDDDTLHTETSLQHVSLDTTTQDEQHGDDGGVAVENGTSTTTTTVASENTTTSNGDSTTTTTTSSSSSSSSSLLLKSLPAFLSKRIHKKEQLHNNHNTTDTTNTDSFLELLETESRRFYGTANSRSSANDDSESSATPTTAMTTSNTNNHHHGTTTTMGYDAATLDILNWLDDDDIQSASKTEADAILLQNKLATVTRSSGPSSKQQQPQPQQQPTLVPLPPVFTSYQEAVLSKESTMQQICDLFIKEQQQQQQQQAEEFSSSSSDAATTSSSTSSSSLEQLRPELYCRMVCQNKSLHTILHGSLADSFEQWRASRPPVLIVDENTTTTATTATEETVSEEQQYTLWIRQQQLAQRIASSSGRSELECETDLLDLVLYHHQSTFRSTSSSSSPFTATTSFENGEVSTTATTTTPSSSQLVRVRNDTLLPMVASMLLSATIPVSAAAVVLSQIIPTFIPLLALPPATERWEAALFLHSEFYLLACYHIPLLVIHLDRYIPGWYWPKLPPDDDAEYQDIANDAVLIGRNLKKQGQIPLSWLVSHLSGECDGTMLPIDMTLRLWDRIITGGQKNSATRFFLTLAVLERQAPALLLLTGDQLLSAVQTVWTLENIDEQKEPNEKEWKYEWWPKAFCLQLSTPVSVLDRLQKVEDDAVQHALKRKQERAEALLRERLEAEAVAYREAQESKADEARIRLSRARLVAFYRKHAPDKESNIEQIMETFSGRLDVLDAKLKGKYGEGFNPAVKAKPPPPPKTNLLAKMNQRLKREKTGIDEEALASAMEERKPVQVSVFVSAEEVLPVMCWSKEATAARGLDQSRRRKANMKRRNALKFYLIDCRSELAAQEQGRFPTAFHLSPETLHDPEKLQEHEDTLESFRGAVHIVIMGEGFNAIPNLYNQKLSPKLQELMEQDESRTNVCALFFQKRGFCFVSLLTGGFCAAHSWLVRDGPKHHLNVSSVLVDYNPENALFGQLETLHNATMTEKAQRKMSNLLEASMVTVTKRAIQLERLTAELNDSKDGQRQGFRKLFGRAETLSATNVVDGVENNVPTAISDNTSVEKSSLSTFQNPFAGKRDETVVDLTTPTTADSESIASDGSILQDALAAPTAELSSLSVVIDEIVPPVAPSGTTGSPTKFGNFFQQTSEVVGVAAAAAAATASSTISNYNSNSSNNTNNTKSKEEVSNPFKGFGAAFQQTRARFGTTPTTSTTSAVQLSTTATSISTTNSSISNSSSAAAIPPSTSPNTGFGFNSLRKSAMSRVVLLQKGTQQPSSSSVPTNNNTVDTDDKQEISVTFV